MQLPAVPMFMKKAMNFVQLQNMMQSGSGSPLCYKTGQANFIPKRAKLARPFYNMCLAWQMDGDVSAPVQKSMECVRVEFHIAPCFVPCKQHTAHGQTVNNQARTPWKPGGRLGYGCSRHHWWKCLKMCFESPQACSFTWPANGNFFFFFWYF